MFLLLFIFNIGLVGMNCGNFRPPPLGSRGGPGSPLLGISRIGHQNKTLFGIFLKTDKSDWAKTIFNLIVPFLRSFWVVTLLFCDNFFHGTQNGQKYQKMAKDGQKWPQNDQKWPERMENDFWNHRHWNSAPLVVVLSGHMTILWQFFLRDPKWPKMTKNGQKWPQNDPK